MPSRNQIVLLYFGAFKVTAVEAQAIQPLVTNSPFLGWLYSVLTVQGVSNPIGCSELAIGVLMATRPLAPRLSAWGSLGAAAVFLMTLSFLVTTPGMWQPVPGFPVPVQTAGGGFLLKDVFLFGAAVWAAGEARQAVRERSLASGCGGARG